MGRHSVLHARQAKRQDLDSVDGRGHVQRGETAGLRDSPLVIEGTAPEAPFKRTPAAAAKVDTPDLALAGGIPERGQGETKLRRPPVVRTPSSGLPWRVPTRLQDAPVICNGVHRPGSPAHL